MISDIFPAAYMPPLVTSPFGPRASLHDNHTGIDLRGRGGATNVPILAVADGRVFDSRATVPDSHTGLNVTTYVCGNYVYLEHEGGWRTYYRHMRFGSVTVAAGQTVKAGQQLGVMGTTGQSTGIHLHFEIHNPAGAPVDPAPYLAGKAEMGNGGISSGLCSSPAGELPPASSAEEAVVGHSLPLWASSAEEAPRSGDDALSPGSAVRVKPSAVRYATGEAIPAWVKAPAQTYTVAQIREDKALLMPIYSWVKLQDVERA